MRLLVRLCPAAPPSLPARDARAKPEPARVAACVPSLCMARRPHETRACARAVALHVARWRSSRRSETAMEGIRFTHDTCLRPINRSSKLCHGRLCNMYMSPASQKGSHLAVMTAPWPSLSPPLRCPG